MARIDPDRVRRHLAQFLEPRCPLCDQQEWVFPETLYEIVPSSSLTALDLQGPTISFSFAGPRKSVLPVTCDVCGYTFFVAGERLIPTLGDDEFAAAIEAEIKSEEVADEHKPSA